jgi:hypothetical protein
LYVEIERKSWRCDGSAHKLNGTLKCNVIFFIYKEFKELTEIKK